MSESDASRRGTAELGLLAFRYAVGELDDAERAAFERRLESDQAAREAVASAVLVMEASSLEHAEEATPPVAGHRRGYALLAAAVLVAGTVALLIQPWNRGKDTTEAASLLSSWVEFADIDEPNPLTPTEDGSSHHNEASDLGVGDGIEDDPAGTMIETPEWLLVALVNEVK